MFIRGNNSFRFQSKSLNNRFASPLSIVKPSYNFSVPVYQKRFNYKSSYEDDVEVLPTSINPNSAEFQV